MSVKKSSDSLAEHSKQNNNIREVLKSANGILKCLFTEYPELEGIQKGHPVQLLQDHAKYNPYI